MTVLNAYNKIYRVSQEECAKFRESVPYVKVYRYNPKHLHPKLNGYGDNCQRTVGTSSVPNTATSTADRHVTQLKSLRLDRTSEQCTRVYQIVQPANFISTSLQPCKVFGNPKDDYGVNASVYVVQFNGFVTNTLIIY
jgi:hypothetical protein